MRFHLLPAAAVTVSTLFAAAAAVPSPSPSPPTHVIHCEGDCSTSRGGHGNHTAAWVLMGGHMYPGVETPSDTRAYGPILCGSGGGLVVVLTADPLSDCALYGSFLLGLGKQLGCPVAGVASVCFTSRAASFSPDVSEVLGAADGLFVTGGDQGKYYSWWSDSPVSDLVNARVNGAGVPIGGSSAGMEIMGQYVFAALHGGIRSETALANPFESEVTIRTGFLSMPPLRNMITGTHFYQRDRMGRLFAFLGRIQGNVTGSLPVGVAASEHTAIVITPDPSGGYQWNFMGVGPAYVIETRAQPTVLEPGRPLGMPDARVTAHAEGLPTVVYAINATVGVLMSSTGTIYEDVKGGV